MDDDFDLEKRLKVVELARINGMFTLRDDDVVKEAKRRLRINTLILEKT